MRIKMSRSSKLLYLPLVSTSFHHCLSKNRMNSKIRQTHLLCYETFYPLWKMRTILLVTLLVAVSALASVYWWQSASAQELLQELELSTTQAGELDLTFGVDGTLTVDLGNKLNDSVTAVAVQADGKVIAAGYCTTAAAGRDFALIRLNPNGALDAAFGSGGRLSFNFNPGDRDDIARAVLAQPDGKILVAGEGLREFGDFDIAVARLNSDGTFDTSFGGDGKVTTNLPDHRPDYGRALALQPDGKILVAGYSNRPGTGDDFVVVRYNADGSLDTTFDGDGILTTDILTNREDRISSISLQADSKIVVAGYTNDPTFKRNFAVVRYNANGSLDTGFGGTGKITSDLNLNSDDIANAVAIQTDGKIAVAGQTADDFGLVRYNSNGSLDTSFGGGDGIVTTNFGSGAVDIGRAVVVQSNGKIIIGGRSRSELAFARYNSNGTLDGSFDSDGLIVQNAGNNYISGFGGYWGMALQADGRIIAAGDGWRDGFGNDFTISRINADGTFDSGFISGDGIAATDLNNRSDEARSVAIQADGKIVLAGSAQNSTGGFDFALLRYNTNGTLDKSFGSNGKVITDINGHNNDHGYAVAVQPDGKILVAGYTNNTADHLVDDAVLLRYTSNGVLDATFGNGGVAILAHKNGLSWLRYHSIALQSDGKIVVAGEAHYFSAYSDGLVARYNTNGTLDSSFGGSTFENPPRPGVTIIHFASLTTFNAVAIQSDGKAVVAGSVNDGPASDFAVARLNLNGSLDTSFDGDGKVTTNFSNGNLDAAYDLAIQPNGKLIAVGETIAAGTGSNFGIARYNSNGSLDTTFGGGTGMAQIDFFGYRDYASAIAIQPDGRIILAGLADDQIPTGWGVAKLTQNGTLDTTFGGGSGRVRTLFGDAVGSALDPAPFDAALQPDGNIVVAGRVNFNSTGRDITVVRYNNRNLACTYLLGATSASFAVNGGNSSVNVTAATGCSWNAISNNDWITITAGSGGSGNGLVNYTVAANNNSQPRTGTLIIADEFYTVTQAGTQPTPVPLSLQLGQVTYQVSEGEANAPYGYSVLGVEVVRGGDTSAPATVQYFTSDQSGGAECNQISGKASQRCDYATAVGTLRFAPGEKSKSIYISIVADGYADNNEVFYVTLQNPTGGSLGAIVKATVTILDGGWVTTPEQNFYLDNYYFVRQNYLDFLGREPDTKGFDDWTNVLNSCGPEQGFLGAPPACDRAHVSHGFFASPEFTDTGFLIYRMYEVGMNRLPRYSEFAPDMAGLSSFGLSDEIKKQNLSSYLQQFVNKQEFINRFQDVLQPSQAAALISRLEQTSGVVLPATATTLPGQPNQYSRQELIVKRQTGEFTLGQTLKAFVEQKIVYDKYFTRGEVTMMYFAYLRRDPDLNDPNLNGWREWVYVFTNGGAERGRPDILPRDIHHLIFGFIYSEEYRKRFGQP